MQIRFKSTHFFYKKYLQSNFKSGDPTSLVNQGFDLDLI